eukprot:CAMPEP_0185727478 /NCGR_PEP_ID=MMETSP1171-20130828/3158_1 /TAXON_ID=374046 /ORGANISM="Helicotheca tamensis, Strain CCMP826" /LENGTH=808 /DNA_ID=CAMNT_0028396057 /DNA_START=84 /DNA_END=2510 /DNA_ORIENTATION=-
MELTLTGASLSGSSAPPVRPSSSPAGSASSSSGVGLVRRQASSTSSSGKPTSPPSQATKRSHKEKDYEDDHHSHSHTDHSTSASTPTTTTINNLTITPHPTHSLNHPHSHATSSTKPCCNRPPPRAFSQPIIQDVQTLVKDKRARFLALCATIKVGTYDAFLQILKAIEEKEGKAAKEKECGLLGADGHTLCHWASKRADDVRFIEYLANTPDVNLHTPSQDSVGMRPIHWAATEGSIPIVALLLRHFEDHPSTTTTATTTSSSDSALNGTASPLFSEPTEAITHTQQGLTAPLDPINARDKSGCTPLLIAAQYGHADLAAFLIKRGADLNAVDFQRDSALHWAAYKGSVPVCGLLLHLHGLEDFLDVQDAFGQTPLHLASLRGNKEVVQYFMDEAEAYCNSSSSARVVGGGLKGYPAYLLTMPDKDSKTPLDLAIKKKRTNVQALLKEYMEQHCSTYSQSASLFFKLQKGVKTTFSLESWKIWMGFTEDAARGNEAPAFPFYITVFSGLGSLCMYPIYYMPLRDGGGLLWDKMGLHMFFILCFIMFLGSFLAVYKTDPGCLGIGGSIGKGRMGERSSGGLCSGVVTNPNGVIQEKMEIITRRLKEEYDATLESYAKSGGTKEMAKTPLCHSCHIAKPLRSKHCRVLRRCILLYDHFCPFVGTAIGLYNYKYFYLFLLFGTLGEGAQLVTWILYLHRSPKFPWGAFCSGLVCSFFVIPMGCMLVYHTQLTAKNLTTNEHINVWKYKYLQDKGGHFSNPFDKGVLKNFVSRFDPGEDSYVLPRRNSSSTELDQSDKKDEEKRDLLQNIV